jgi:hypothetical protein
LARKKVVYMIGTTVVTGACFALAALFETGVLPTSWLPQYSWFTLKLAMWGVGGLILLGIQLYYLRR